MKIKVKLIAGIVFLFIQFLVIALFSAYSIYNISKQSEKIMKDNNLSIQYAESMLQTIDRINAVQLAVLFSPANMSRKQELAEMYGKFEESFNKQSKNVTEPGENELNQLLTGEFQSYKISVAELHAIKDKSDFYFQKLLSKYDSLKSIVYRISELNMQAIIRKNQSVIQYERRSYVILTITASVCFLLSIVFIFNFPGIITDPIKQVSESLRGIADRNYDIRLDFKSDGEFREMEDALRLIVDRLKMCENSQMEKVSQERARIADTIDQSLGILSASNEQIRNLDIRKILEAQSAIIEQLKNKLEQSKHELNRA